MEAEVSVQLTSHDRCVLHLASRDAEGRLGFYLDEDGVITLLGKGESQPVPAEESLPKLEEGGLLSRGLSRTYVLTPQGWETVRELVELAS